MWLYSIYCLKIYFSEHCINNISKMVLTNKTLHHWRHTLFSWVWKHKGLCFKYGKTGNAFFLCLGHFHINFIQSTHQLRAWCSNETDESKEGGNPCIQISIIFQGCSLEIMHLFFSNSIRNYFGKISIWNYLFCGGSAWQEVYKLAHHWYMCITCHDKGLGLEGTLQFIKSLFYGWENWDPENLRQLTKSQSFHSLKNQWEGASLVAQLLRICLPMQGTRVRALAWEDPTCRGAAGPVSHNYWACASGACAPATREAAIVRGPRTVMKSGARLPQLEKALAQKQRPITVKNK